MNNAGSPKPQVCSTPGVDCRFSYLPPTVTSINPPRTIGGAVTVYGENFGPAGTAANATVEGLGRAVQVEPMQPMLKAPGTKRLKLKNKKLLSNFASKLNCATTAWSGDRGHRGRS